ncbi:SDR family NAD(P)-dependent oxidoreductase [Rhodobacter sp. NTK016B]|uniref:SDR family NAD(P)-dependent oxidoreductase n=1 Tax=Rhodobacter sp. NTK016B TaxID=2759676 RepID=UPI0039C9DC5B
MPTGHRRQPDGCVSWHALWPSRNGQGRRRRDRQYGVYPWVGRFATAGAYVAAKHGVVGLTKVAAIEYAKAGVRVNAVGPGFIATPLLDKNLDAAALDGIAALHPVGRPGEAAEVSAMTCFLLSDQASFITGSYHLIDGGYSAQ